MKLYIKLQEFGAPSFEGVVRSAQAELHSNADGEDELRWISTPALRDTSSYWSSRASFKRSVTFEPGQKPGVQLRRMLGVGEPWSLAIVVQRVDLAPYTRTVPAGRKGQALSLTMAAAILAEDVVPSTPDWALLELEDDTPWSALREAFRITESVDPLQHLQGKPALPAPDLEQRAAAIPKLLTALWRLKDAGVPVTSANYYGGDPKVRISVMLDLADIHRADSYPSLRDLALPADNEHTFPGSNKEEL